MSEQPTFVIMGSLDDRVAHTPSRRHGVAYCGESMRDPWRIGPPSAFEGWEVCEDGCFDNIGH
jgi:hypothetical protein